MSLSPWWSHVLMLLGATVVGAAVPLQTGTNAQLARYVGHPLWSSCVSLTLSLTIGIALVLLLRLPLPRASSVARAPAWAWTGGFYGILFLVTSMVVAPRLGAAVFMVAVIGGQLIASLVIDRFALVGFEQKAVTPWRLAGMGLIILGIFLIQFTPGTARAAGDGGSVVAGRPPDGPPA